MTLEDVNAWAVENVYEHCDMKDIAEWLGNLDARLWRDVIRQHEGWESVPQPSGYSADHPEQILLLSAPDAEMYLAYVEYHINRRLGDAGRANDAYTLYVALSDEWMRAYIRDHKALPVRFQY